MLNHFFNVREGRVNIRSLIGAGKEARLPVLGVLNGIAMRTHGDKTGQILVFAAKSVGNPRPHAWAGQAGLAAVHQQQARLVVGNVGVKRFHNAKVVGKFGEVRENIADFRAALSVLLEAERRFVHGSGFAFRGKVGVGKRLSVILFQRGLVIKGVYVRRPAIHKQENHALGFRGEMRFFGARGFKLRRSSAWAVFSPIMPAMPSAANPLPMRFNNCRRVINISSILFL